LAAAVGAGVAAEAVQEASACSLRGSNRPAFFGTPLTDRAPVQFGFANGMVAKAYHHSEFASSSVDRFQNEIGKT
jgi:hypothetical protein